MEFLCTNCGFVSKNRICPKCKHSIPKIEYSELIKKAKDSLRYGHQYKIYYQKQYEEKKTINIKPSLYSPDNLVELLAAGVIVNFSYDIIKKIAFQIHSKIKTKKKSRKHIDTSIEIILENKTQLNKFIKNIKAYEKGLKKINPKVKEAILEEEKADYFSKAIARKHKLLAKAYKDNNFKEFQNIIEQALLKAFAKYNKMKK